MWIEIQDMFDVEIANLQVLTKPPYHRSFSVYVLLGNGSSSEIPPIAFHTSNPNINSIPAHLPTYQVGKNIQPPNEMRGLSSGR